MSKVTDQEYLNFQAHNGQKSETNSTFQNASEALSIINPYQKLAKNGKMAKNGPGFQWLFQSYWDKSMLVQ